MASFLRWGGSHSHEPTHQPAHADVPNAFGIFAFIATIVNLQVLPLLWITILKKVETVCRIRASIIPVCKPVCSRQMPRLQLLLWPGFVGIFYKIGSFMNLLIYVLYFYNLVDNSTLLSQGECIEAFF